MSVNIESMENKVVIVGSGIVGMTIAYQLLTRKLSNDILIIEINGIFYHAIDHLEKQQKEKITHMKIFEYCSKQIMSLVDRYEKYLQKNASILIVMDGVAPLMKMRTQRQRRLKNCIKKSSVDSFDLNALSVGTTFINFMSKYIDWWLRKYIHSNNQTNNKSKNFSFYFNFT